MPIMFGIDYLVYKTRLKEFHGKIDIQRYRITCPFEENLLFDQRCCAVDIWAKDGDDKYLVKSIRCEDPDTQQKCGDDFIKNSGFKEGEKRILYFHNGFGIRVLKYPLTASTSHDFRNIPWYQLGSFWMGLGMSLILLAGFNIWSICYLWKNGYETRKRPYLSITLYTISGIVISVFCLGLVLSFMYGCDVDVFSRRLRRVEGMIVYTREHYECRYLEQCNPVNCFESNCCPWKVGHCLKSKIWLDVAGEGRYLIAELGNKCDDYYETKACLANWYNSHSFYAGEIRQMTHYRTHRMNENKVPTFPKDYTSTTYYAYYKPRLYKVIDVTHSAILIGGSIIGAIVIFLTVCGLIGVLNDFLDPYLCKLETEHEVKQIARTKAKEFENALKKETELKKADNMVVIQTKKTPVFNQIWQNRSTIMV